MIKRLLPAVIAVATLASTAYTLTLLDQVVHGTLYSHGLQFSLDWANPYWTLLRITLALLAVCAVATTINVILILRPNSKGMRRVRTSPSQKAPRNIPVTAQTVDRTATTSTVLSPQPPQPKPTPKPTPVTTPISSPASPDASALFKCAHCRKSFTQPLRMLNFQVDPPRIVNVCPFCNETMPSGFAVKESEQVENRSSLEVSNNNGRKPVVQ